MFIDNTSQIVKYNYIKLMENYQEVPWDSINQGDLIKVITTSNAQPLDDFDCMLNYDGEVMRKQNNPSESILRKTDGSLVPVVSDDIYAHGCEVTFYKYIVVPFNIARYETSGKLKRRRPHPGDYNGLLDEIYRRRPRKRRLSFGAPKEVLTGVPRSVGETPKERLKRLRHLSKLRNAINGKVRKNIVALVNFENHKARVKNNKYFEKLARLEDYGLGRDPRQTYEPLPRSGRPTYPKVFLPDDYELDPDYYLKNYPQDGGASGSSFGKKRNLKGNLKILKKDLKKIKNF